MWKQECWYLKNDQSPQKSLCSYMDSALGCKKHPSSYVFVLYSWYLRQLLLFPFKIKLGKNAYEEKYVSSFIR